jgi:ribosomal protein S18 acetylase RimI-like enzyme
MDYSLGFPIEAHTDQISKIWESGWHEAHAEIVPTGLRELRTAKSFFDRTTENLSNTRIVSDGSKVLGFCMVKENELYQMYVSRIARGSGAAQALIEDAESRIIAAGHSMAWLACAMGNERAAHFYEKFGWNNTGREVVHLDTSEGVFPMEVWRFEKQVNTPEVS